MEEEADERRDGPQVVGRSVEADGRDGDRAARGRKEGSDWGRFTVHTLMCNNRPASRVLECFVKNGKF